MNVRKRGLALLMCICMIFTLLPFSALADSTGNGNGEAGTGEPAGAPVTEPPAPPTVVAGHAKIGETDYPTLDDALAAAQSGDTIYLGEGVYSVYGSTTINDKGLTLTFVGSGRDKTTWNIGTGDTDTHSQGNADFGFRGNESLTFKNMTLRAGVQKNGTQVAWDYVGFAHTNYTKVDNCDINGKTAYWGYKTAEFKDCTFNCPESDYALWYYTGNEMTFDKCTFNASGKIINVYREGHGSVTIPDKNYGDSAENPIVLNYKDCTVNSTKPNKSVLNIKDTGDYGKIFYYEVNITGDNTVLGLNADSTTCSRLFQVTGDTATVTINGVTVWKDGGMVDAAAYHKDGVTVSGVSYDDGNANANDSLYTDGYKDNAITETTSADGKTVTKTCQYCGWTESYTKQDWNINVSKTATNLKKDANGDYKTNVTLSVPGVEENLATDVLLVLDSSRCSKDMLLATVNLLDNLAKQAENGANIKLGIVMFKGNAVPFKTFDSKKSIADIRDELSALVVADDPEGKLTKAAVRKYIAESCPQIMNSGTNIPAGLQLAKNMLAADTSVADSRKYMVFVSDGNTYLFCHENADGTGYDYTKAWSRTGPTTKQLGGIAEYENWDQDSEAMAQFNYAKGTSHDWTNYIAAVKANNDRFTKYDYEVAVAGEIPEGAPVIPETDTNRVVNSDVSRYQTATLYKELISKYNCYYCALPEGGYILARPMLCDLTPADHLIDGTNIDTNIFSGITKDMFFAVGAGSTIEDTIGKDFTLDTESIKLTVGKTEYVAAKTDSVEGTIKYNFSKTSDADPTFSLVYTVNSKTFTLNIGEDISYAAPVQLSYTLKLTTPETKPGTYGQLDLKGDGYIDGKDTETKVDTDKALYTNEKATLTPVDSNGKEGMNKYFPKPSVEYTVRNPYRPPVNPGIGDKITVEITGNSDSVVYDGTEHSVKDYTVKISDSRYTEKDFTFSGKALASGINAGAYEMGLKADHFKNTNARFKNVEFIIKADGVLTITQRPLTITAGSAEGIAPVTCDKYTVEGLATGDKVDSVKITGIQSEPGESPNVASDAVIKNAKGEDVTANYKITYVDGVLKAIEVLNKEIHFNYVIGYTDGTIRPNNDISRAEVATIFFRLLTDEARTQYDKTTSSFSDIKDGAWCCRAVSTLTNMGIIKGYTDGSFQPNKSITRAELATIIARFAKLDVNTKTFSDINGHWAQKNIELAAGNGWINGYEDGTFRPNNNITRAETFAMINRVLDRQTESVSDLLPTSEMNMWSDNMNENAWYYKDVQEATNYHKCDRVGDSVYEKWTEKVPDIDWASYQI